MCLTFQILSPEIQRGLFIKSTSQTPSYTKFREQFLLLYINLSLMLYPWNDLLLTQTLPFTDKKGFLRQTVSYIPPSQTYIWREREKCSVCCGSLCTKSEAWTVQEAEENHCSFWSIHFSCQITASVLSYLKILSTFVKAHRQRLIQPHQEVCNSCICSVHNQSCASSASAQ